MGAPILFFPPYGTISGWTAPWMAVPKTFPRPAFLAPGPPGPKTAAADAAEAATRRPSPGARCAWTSTAARGSSSWISWSPWRREKTLPWVSLFGAGCARRRSRRSKTRGGEKGPLLVWSKTKGWGKGPFIFRWRFLLCWVGQGPSLFLGGCPQFLGASWSCLHFVGRVPFLGPKSKSKRVCQWACSVL